MKIGIDIDDTIADSYEVIFAYAQDYTINQLGKSAKVQEITAKHHSYVNAMHQWTETEEKHFWDTYYGEIIQKIKPFTLAVETIQKLKKEGHEIIIVTARWPEEKWDVEKITLEWLKENKIEYNEIVLNANNKAKIALEQKLDILIDDSFQNCQEVTKVGMKTYMMETRTNKGLEAQNIKRVYSWPDIYNQINSEK